MAKLFKMSEDFDYEVTLEIIDELPNLVDAMNEKESEVCNKISDTFKEVEYPVNLFNEKSVDELNEIFGGHDDMVITENVRATLNALRIMEEINKM